MTLRYWLVGWLWGVSVLAHAHDPGLSTAQGTVLADAIELHVGFAPGDVEQLLPAGQRGDVQWSPQEFARVQPLLAELAPRLWSLQIDGRELALRGNRVQLAAGDNVSFQLVYARTDYGGRLTMRAGFLEALPPGHRQFVTLQGATGVLAQKLVNAKDPEVMVAIGARAGTAATPAQAPPSFWGFLKLGVEHIWLGYDHLLFLFALLIVCGSLRAVVTIISCFTLAHSLTLALATLDVVNVPARLVEPLIAASIVFVGVENLLRRGEEPAGRWALTFVFGLIHGFGFAGVLRDLGVGGGDQGIAVPLLAFNLGVELGQIAIAALVLPLIWRLRRNEKFLCRGVPALSGLVALAGLWWLIERTLL